MSDITVKIGKGVGGVKPVTVPVGTLVKDAIRKAELNSDGMEVRVNGKTINADSHTLVGGETVMILRKIRGA